MKAHTKTALEFIGSAPELLGFRLQWLSLLTFAILLNSHKTQAQTVKNFATKEPFLFEENKGQLPPDPQTRKSNIKYYGHSGGVYVYCKEGMLSFVFTKVEKEAEQISEATGQRVSDVGVQNSEPLHLKQFDRDRHSLGEGGSKISTARMDLVLIGSNLSADITPTDEQEYYENFYTTGDADHGITGVHTYKTLIYKNIYPNIDMIVNVADKSGLEYSFLVHPGGNVGDIQLRWNGAEHEEALRNGGVKYVNMLGTMEESAPKSFVEGKLVESRFIENGFNYGFKVGDYNKEKDLVIDPSLVWGTYFGGSDKETGIGVCLDHKSNILFTGITASTAGIASSGAYQTSNAGNDDTYLTKFDGSGKRIWSTYFGGIYNEEVAGICADSSGNAFITGYTQSPGGIATAGAYQTSCAGYNDVFIEKFTSSGLLSWGTYYGGAYNDKSTGISIDISGNLYITGTTSSDNGIATSGTFLTTASNTGSYISTFLAKFTNSGSRLWGTYFGDLGGDAFGTGVSADKSGNVYITGWTADNTNIATSGAYQTTVTGTAAFLAKFNGSGNIIWGTYYGGGDDQANCIATDTMGNAYITGLTSNLAGDGFLAKFNKSGNLIWGTHFGGNNYCFANGICIDLSGNINITGMTEASKGLATSGACYTSYSGGHDAFVAQFKSAGKLNYATYYNGSISGYNFSAGYGICSDMSGNVYITGITSDSHVVVTTGAYQTSFGGGDYDAFLAKFNLWSNYDAGIINILSPKTSFCADSEQVIALLQNFGRKELDSVKIGWSVNGKLQAPYSWSGKLRSDSSVSVALGKFNFTSVLNSIKIWTYKPNGVFDSITENDTDIVIDSTHSPSAIYSVSVNKCGFATFQASPAASSATSISSYTWSGAGASGYAPLSISGRTGSYQYTRGGTYYYKLSVTGANGCARLYNDSLILGYSPGEISLPPDTTVCANTSLTIKSTLLRAFSPYSVWWSNLKDSKGDSITSTSITETITKDTFFRVNIIAQGCTNYDSMKVKVRTSIQPNLGPDLSGCQGKSFTLSTHSKHALSTAWTFIKGSDTISNAYHGDTIITKDSGIYIITVQDSIGCRGSDTVVVNINPLPIVYAGSDISICKGNSVSLGAKPDSGYSYNWTSSPSGFSSTIANPSLVPNASATYYLAVTSNKTGCTGFDTTSVSLNPLPKASFPNIADSIFCGLDSVDWTYSSSGAVSYLWKFGDGTSDTGKNVHKHLFTKTGSHYYIRLIVTNTSGCSDSAETSVYPDGDCVWPGDANHDKADNIYDVLAVGIGYNTKGHYRLDTSTQWYGHGCLDWYQSFKSGTNYKHADCNGDGTIDSSDLAAIVRNYGKTHSKSGGASGGNPSDPALYLATAKDSVDTQDTLQIQMNLGTSAKPVSDIYGLCFSIKYDPVNVNQSKGIIADFSKCWLGTLNKNLVYIIHNDSSSGVLDIGITRTDHTNVSGYGPIGVLSIITPDNVGGKKEVRKELHFDIENVKAIDNVENDISLYTTGDSVLFYGYTSGIKPLGYSAGNIRVYPNPANSILHLDAGNDFISEIALSNILGQRVLWQTCNRTQQMDLNIENLVPGTYFINVQTNTGMARARFVKE